MVSSLGARGTDLAATAAADERPESREWPSETDHRRPASTKASHTHLKSALSPASNPQQQQQQQQPPPKQPTNNQQQKATTTAAPNNAHTAPAPPPPLASTYSTCKRRRLSYAQSLLLRKWPYLAVGICIMGSLLFGILLSALTVYLTSQFGSRDCSALAERLEAVEAASRGAAGLAPLLRPAAAGAEPPGGYAAMAPEPAGLLSSYSAGEMLMFDSQQSGASGSGSPSSQRPQFQRLPSSVWPQHYDLFVQPHIAEPFTFDGRLAIKLECRSATDNITLHTNDLAIDQKSLKLRRASSTSAQAGQTTGAPKVRALLDDRQLQYSIVQLDGPLEAGAEYVLEMNFTGNLNDDLAGFYKIKYQSVEGRTVWIAATQFQATDARRAFPCFDEPLYKATFSIQIKHWKNMTALSNMPIIDRVDSPDGLWVTDTFAKSHKMSTYLVAYAVTNFESRSQGNISVWTRPGFTHTAEYALEIAGKILRYYEEFFGIEYPLPKMDMIALPDFNAGAMENWGLITYRETAMLFDANYSSLTNKQRISVVVAHELAHQWFGNLVTPKWWDDLWLNEGFASYVEYLGVDHVAPKWRMLDQFAVEEVQNVFKLDALPSSHQISIPVNNPDEISEIFDHISYAKGASIIRMMKHFLEKNVFETGLRRYLRALRYSNAEQSDLWRHLTEAQRAPSSSSNRTGASHKQASAGGHELVDVEKVMNSWTLQTGFPLVTLKRHYSGQARDFSAELSQVRYKPHRLTRASNQTTTPALGSYSETERWEVPITYTWSSEQNWEPKLRAWMHQNETAPVKLSGALLPAPDDEWVLMNVNQVGYYRVNYDIRNWKLLIQQLLKNHTKIGPTNRAQIIDDMFELARSAMLDYDLALEATTYLVKEHDNLPWDSALLALSYVDDMLERTPLYGDWRDFVSDLIAPYYSRFKEVDMSIKLGKQQNASADVEADVLEQENQVSAINWACHIFDECISRAKHMFREWRSTGVNKIDPAFRYTIYCTAIENGNKDDWDFLWAYYEHEQNASERDRIMKALGCTKQIWLLARYLEATFSKNTPIRRQDGTFVFRMIARNNYGRDIAFNFMRERWQTIKEHYGKTSFSLGHLIRSISLSMNTHIELNQLVSFYESIKNDVGSGKRSFQIAIEEVETNVLWKDRNYAKLERWLGQWKANKASKKNRLPAAPAA